MATMIGNMAVGLTLDARSYIDQSKLSRKEAQALERDINKARTPTENYARSVDRLEKALRSGAISQKTYNELLLRYEQRANGASVATAKYSSVLTGMQARFLSTAGASALLFDSVREFADLDASLVTMEKLTGSVARAKNLMDQVREISATTPLTFKGSADAVRTMLLFGIAQEDVIGRLRQLGDITGGDTERMKSLTLAFSQATAAGRLQGQDLRQMIDAGFNPLKTIAEQTGETLDQVRDRMSKLGSGAELMNKAFDDASKSLGLLDAFADRPSGKLAIMQSRIQMLKIELGQQLMPLLEAAPEHLDKFANSLTPLMRNLAATTELLVMFDEKLDRVAGDGASDLLEDFRVISLSILPSMLDVTRQTVKLYGDYEDRLEAIIHLNREYAGISNLAGQVVGADMEELTAKAEAHLSWIRESVVEAAGRLGRAPLARMQSEREAMEQRREQRQKQIEKLRENHLARVEQREKRIAEMRKTIEGRIADLRRDQGRLANDIQRAEEAHQKKLSQMAKEREDRFRKMFQDVSQGPGEVGRVEFLARQENERIARIATRNQSRIESAQQANAPKRVTEEEKRLLELKALQAQQNAELQRQTTLLEGIKDKPGVRRKR